MPRPVGPNWRVDAISLQGGRVWTPISVISPPLVASSNTTNVVWLDPSDIYTLPSGAVVNGGSINRVLDKSGNNHHAIQNTLARQPIVVMNGLNGMITLRFNGLAGSSGTALTCDTGTWGPGGYPAIFAVGSRSATGTSYRCMINLGHTGAISNTHAFFGARDNNFTTFFGTGNNITWNDTLANTPNISMLNNFSIWSVINNSSTGLATPYVNGTAQNTKNGTMGALSTGYRVGSAGGSTTTQNFAGDIAEIIIIPSGYVTTDIRLKFEGYLAHKWSLAASLPPDHLYRNVPPMITPAAQPRY